MIKRDAKLEIRVIPLEHLRVTELQKRYRSRLDHYLDLLEKNTEDHLGFVLIKRNPNLAGYEILDGHHRYMALLMSGREDALCVIIDEENND